MAGSLRLGKIAGIDVYAHLSWFIILVLLTWSLADDWFARLFPGWPATTYWIAAFVSALLLFVCVLVHELAHALIARTYGLSVKNITLFIFGGVANIKEEMKRPGVEFQVAIAGPIASFLLAGFAFILVLPLRGTGASAEAVLDYLIVSNVLLGVFNLIPGFPLDGGRVLRSIIWKATRNYQKATRIASAVGQGAGYVFILLGIIAFFTGNFFTGLWTVFIGWFLLSAAQSAVAQVEVESNLQGVSVKHVMNRDAVTVPANISLQRLVEDYFLPQGLSTAPVTQGDYLMGLITLAAIVHVPREQWSSTLVGHTMLQLEQVYTASPEQPLLEVLEMVNDQNINQVPVVQDGRFVGVLSRESILRYLQIRQSLSTEKPRYAA